MLGGRIVQSGGADLAEHLEEHGYDWVREKSGGLRLAMATESDVQALEGLDRYKYGFSDPDEAVFKAERGLNRGVVEQISAMKEEPAWMLEYRLKALEHYLPDRCPTWGPDLSQIDFDNIIYYVRPAEAEGKTWDEVPETIKQHLRQAGHPGSRAEVPGWRRRPVRVGDGLPQHPEAPGGQGRDLRQHRRRPAQAPRSVPPVLRHRDPPHRQQVRRAEHARSGRGVRSSTSRRA